MFSSSAVDVSVEFGDFSATTVEVVAVTDAALAFFAAKIGAGVVSLVLRKSGFQQFADDATAAGLAPRGGHQLRHSACSLMVAAGVHPRIIMAIMGHGSASTTMAIYAHVGPDSLANWSAAMDRLFGGGGAV